MGIATIRRNISRHVLITVEGLGYDPNGTAGATSTIPITIVDAITTIG